MFTNISDLMSAYGVNGFAKFRISRRGNWVVSGEGSLTYHPRCGYDFDYMSGKVEYYSITAVYKNDGTGTLIDYTVEECGGYDF